MASSVESTLSRMDPAIRRGRIEQLTIYEITEAELEKLEHGTPASLLLNFAIFLLSLAASFLVALLTTTISSTSLFIVFVIVTTIGFMVGLVLLALWRREHLVVTDIAECIRRRLPPEGTPSEPILLPPMSTTSAT